jgi:GAF domain-containing protein
MMTKEQESMLAEIDILISREKTPEARVHRVMEFLAARHSHFYWTGVFVLRGEELHVGPYVGPHTDHTRIPVGRGVCGSAVKNNTNRIVDDVRAESNYLACNLQTRSEIVVLIRDPEDKKILGQIDIDSTRLKGFGPADEAFLDAVGQRLAGEIRELVEKKAEV